ncbi:Cys-tRNA(Pro) deacylase [Deltaproteobacteria bacterium OttesenSCG-928-K17]|nr:Cys-tRNA(Pro) deacylase [Deltaproteobacteria bacterium OttesenSCG-928-K17]
MKIKKTNAARILDEMGLPYEMKQFDIDESDLSAETAAKKLGAPLETVYKTLVARGDKTGVLEACLPAGRELDLKALAAASGNKSVALAAVKELPGLTGYQRGGCSPLGGKKEYPVYILDEIMNHELIIINAGGRGLMFFMNPGDLVKAARATLAPIARKQ